MCPIPHTFAYIPESKLLETNGARQIMFRMGPVHAWDNKPGVSVAEAARTLGTGTYCTPKQE